MNELISELVGYGIEKGLVEEDDKIYVINRLLELFRLDSYTQTDKAIRQSTTAYFPSRSTSIMPSVVMLPIVPPVKSTSIFFIFLSLPLPKINP